MKIELLKELCEIFAPTGREGKIIKFVQKKLEQFGFSSKIDSLGNVIALKGRPPYKVFMTHLDQPAWIVEHQQEDGILQLKPVPRDSKKTSGWAIDAQENKYLIFGDREGKKMYAEPLHNNKIENSNTFLIPSPNFEVTENAYYSNALFDRFSIAAMLSLAEDLSSTEQSLALVFYVGRYLNFMGVSSALKSIEFQSCFSLEAIPVGEMCVSAHGAVVGLRTKGAIAPEDYLIEFDRLAKDQDVKIQKSLLTGISSPADSLSRQGVTCIVIGVPVTYSGSRTEKILAVDGESLQKLLVGLV